METMSQLVSQASDYLWNVILIILLCGTGIYYTIRLRFIQVRKFREGCRLVFGHMTMKGEKGEAGEMTPFQSVATAIAAQVGTGNLTGAATALISGGPGAIFWMWMSAFFGMATIYSEAVLAQEYKTVEHGEVTGGPVYYIRAAFKGTFGKFLAGCFAVLEKLVPFMAGIYIVGSLILIGLHITALPGALKMIFVGAFNPSAVGGAALGITVREAIRFGVARGLFSNEAGMGSTPHAHARAKAKNPHEQGLAAIVSVFVDTFIVLNLTVFSILTTGAIETGKNGTALTQAAFATSFPAVGDIFVAVCLLFFAFSTILGWQFFGLVNVKYLFGEKAGMVYSLLVVVFVVIGSALKLDLVWALSDFFNGLMVIPNAIALWALSGVVVRICRKYQDQKVS